MMETQVSTNATMRFTRRSKTISKTSNRVMETKRSEAIGPSTSRCGKDSIRPVKTSAARRMACLYLRSVMGLPAGGPARSSRFRYRNGRLENWITGILERWQKLSGQYSIIPLHSIAIDSLQFSNFAFTTYLAPDTLEQEMVSGFRFRVSGFGDARHFFLYCPERSSARTASAISLLKRATA